MAGCGSKGKSDSKEVGDTSNTSDTINTASQSESSKGEEITTEETTTEVEPETKKNFSTTLHLVGNEWFEYLLDYKDVIVSAFNNRIFNPGEVIDVRNEIISLGYDLDEYSKVFSPIHQCIGGCADYSFSLIELNPDFIRYPIINDVDNFVYRVDEEEPFTVNIKFDEGGNMILTLTTY